MTIILPTRAVEANDRKLADLIDSVRRSGRLRIVGVDQVDGVSRKKYQFECPEFACPYTYTEKDRNSRKRAATPGCP